MMFLKWGSKGARAWKLLVFLGVAAAFVVSGVAVLANLPQASGNLAVNGNYPRELRDEYAAVVRSVQGFKQIQAKSGSKIVSDRQLDRMLSQIQIDAASGQFHQAQADIKQLRTSLANWRLEMQGGTTSAADAPGGVNVPILLYHYTPPNFEQQVKHLEQHGYTTVDLDQVLAGMHGGPLPPKPVVITFDDGFANQMQAFEILKRHQMKATFYIITSGEASQWCIGSGRRRHDPLQPPHGCGDDYLNWDQVRQLDKSGLITIGGHTVNHRNLATLSEEDQRFEIAGGKDELEKQIGHPVHHFAYPYGAYNALSIEIAREAGYLTAVTTQPGTHQGPGMEFTLLRVRDALVLP